jgi:hypothetical protein
MKSSSCQAEPVFVELARPEHDLFAARVGVPFLEGVCHAHSSAGRDLFDHVPRVAVGGVDSDGSGVEGGQVPHERWGWVSAQVSAGDHVAGFVDGGEVPDPVADAFDHPPGVAGEVAGHVWVCPAAGVGDPRRQGEVLQRHDRFDAAFQAGVDHVLVVLQSGLVELSRPRLDAGPFNREAVGVQAQIGQQADVVSVPTEVVARLA